jgi:hypothetical protein
LFERRRTHDQQTNVKDDPTCSCEENKGIEAAIAKRFWQEEEWLTIGIFDAQLTMNCRTRRRGSHLPGRGTKSMAR